MKTVIKGEIIDFIPIFRAFLDKEGIIISENGDHILTVDTGFSGALALPQKVIDEMDYEFIGYDTFSLATGDIVDLPIFLGRVIINNQEIETWFIPGNFLVGMEFFSFVGKFLTLDLESEIVELKG